MQDKAATRDIFKRINLSLDIAVARRLIKIEDEKRRESDSEISGLNLEHRLVVSKFSVGSIIVLSRQPLEQYQESLVSEYQAYLNREFYVMRNKKGL